MFENITIGDRIKLEHIKSKSFIDSVAINIADDGRWLEIPGGTTFYNFDGWEIVS